MLENTDVAPDTASALERHPQRIKNNIRDLQASL